MRSLHAATIASIGILLTGCSPDAVSAPPRQGLNVESANAARVSGVVTTTIIPVVPIVPPPNPDTPSGQATAINEAGVVAGWKMSPTEIYAFTWRDGVMTSLGTAYPERNENLDAFFRPVAINRSGDVAGNNGWGEAVVWRNGKLTVLAESGGRLRYAYAMNDKGQIVGSGSVPGQGVQQAYLWDNGTFTELGTLGGSFSVATAINNHAEVVGYSRTAGDVATHAFLWKRGVMTDLGTMAGGSSYAYAINDKGEVAGLSSYPSGSPMPFMWRKGVMRWLLPEPMSSAAFYTVADLSDAGHVVGSRSLGSSSPHAFVWRDGVIVDVGGSETHGLAVNSRGEIAGYKDASVGLPGAYLWTVGRQGP